MHEPQFSRREWFTSTVGGGLATGLALGSPVATAAGTSGQLDNNFQVVDLTDLSGDLPLDVVSTKQVLRQTEDWEHSTWKNPKWPAGGGNTVGYPTVVRNVHGPRPDGRFYLFYAHHDPRSGIGAAVADSLTGPYSKRIRVPGRRDNQVVPSFHGYSRNPGDPSHNSSPWVVWNPDRRLWFMYFHFFNHAHTATTNFQPTALATWASGAHRALAAAIRGNSPTRGRRSSRRSGARCGRGAGLRVAAHCSPPQNW